MDEETRTPENPSLLLDRYRIEGMLGEGGLGTVYKAYDTRLKRFVAIKTLKRSVYTNDPDLYRNMEERFFREGQAGSRMHVHPNLVVVYDFVTDTDKSLYLIQEFVPGGTLAGRLAKEGALPQSDALRLAGDVARGLYAAHEMQIVHRDVKPANIFLSADGRARVGDFGIAQLDDLSGRTRATAGHPGTPLYMSPEQANSSGYVRAESDQYSLGLVLFEMLTGQTFKRLRKRQAEELLSQQPQPIQNLVRRMISEDPEDRFETTMDVATEIGRIERQLASAATQIPSSPVASQSESIATSNDTIIVQDLPTVAAEPNVPVPAPSEPVATGSETIIVEHLPTVSAEPDVPVEDVTTRKGDYRQPPVGVQPKDDQSNRRMPSLTARASAPEAVVLPTATEQEKRGEISQESPISAPSVFDSVVDAAMLSVDEMERRRYDAEQHLAGSKPEDSSNESEDWYLPDEAPRTATSLHSVDEMERRGHDTEQHLAWSQLAQPRDNDQINTTGQGEDLLPTVIMESSEHTTVTQTGVDKADKSLRDHPPISYPPHLEPSLPPRSSGAFVPRTGDRVHAITPFRETPRVNLQPIAPAAMQPPPAIPAPKPISRRKILLLVGVNVLIVVGVVGGVFALSHNQGSGSVSTAVSTGTSLSTAALHSTAVALSFKDYLVNDKGAKLYAYPSKDAPILLVIPAHEKIHVTEVDTSTAPLTFLKTSLLDRIGWVLLSDTSAGAPSAAPTVTPVPVATTAPIVANASSIAVPPTATPTFAFSTAKPAITSAPLLPLPFPATYVIGNTGGSSVNVRATPDSRGQLLGNVTEGETVQVTGHSIDGRDGRQWFPVLLNNNVPGFIPADFLRRKEAQ